MKPNATISSSNTSKSITIALLVFLVLLIPTILVGLYYYQAIDTNLTNVVFAQRETAAGLSASALKVKLDQLAAIDERYAADPTVAQAVAQGDWNSAKDAIVNLQNISGNYDYFINRTLLLNTSGTIEVAFPGISANRIGQQDVSFSEWQTPILADGAPYFVSDVFSVNNAPRTNFIEIVAPIKQGTQIVGLADITVPTNEFSDFGKDVDITDDGFVYIVDRLGHIVSHPKYASDDPIIDYSSLPIVQAVIAGQSGSGISYNPIEQEMRAVAYEPVPVYGWGVISQEPTFEAFASRNEILLDVVYAIIAFCVIDALFAGMILYLLTHRHEK
jgi:cache domain-containing protein